MFSLCSLWFAFDKTKSSRRGEIMKRLLVNCSAFVIAIMLPMNAELTSATTLQKFNRWGISFEYPKNWEEMSAEETSKIKHLLSRETESIKHTLVNFSAIGIPYQAITVYVSKQKIEGVVTIQDLLAAQKYNLDPSKKGGLSTKVWRIEQLTLSNLPAIVSDFETTKGRIYGLTMLTKDHMVIIQCSAKDFEKYKQDFDHIFSTLRIQLEKNLYHEVSKGETLYRISRKYGLSVDELQRLNNLKNNQIYPKQKLLVTPDSQQ